FELADGGTIFLDEIGEMSLPLQVKLLRVLQERRFEPVGSERTVEVDVRVVAATNRDLEQAIAEGMFREDLYYRLNVVELQLPALRDRADDVPRLAGYFNDRMGAQRGRKVRRFTDEAMGALCRYGWPGNVRELENIVERLTVFCDDEVVELEDLPAKIVRPRHTRADVPLDLPDEGVDLRAVLQELEERLILQALERTAWNKNRAATLLGLNRTTLVEKLKKRGMLRGRPAG
ncbi:MAG: sigma-54-dependent Fis family transcriptional regulator, partial [Myxococcales bacterium]|nr:sigma-54-dependent Fis family transcriptional regulator [Myxococcales bacterium]